jgi:hypothetical protein
MPPPKVDDSVPPPLPAKPQSTEGAAVDAADVQVDATTASSSDDVQGEESKTTTTAPAAAATTEDDTVVKPANSESTASDVPPPPPPAGSAPAPLMTGKTFPVSLLLDDTPTGSVGPTTYAFSDSPDEVSVHYYIRLMITDWMNNTYWNTHEVAMHRSSLSNISSVDV